jgi:hypothetical protein
MFVEAVGEDNSHVVGESIFPKMLDSRNDCFVARIDKILETLCEEDFQLDSRKQQPCYGVHVEPAMEL